MLCNFFSHTFGFFQGVITDVSYSINSGESFAKWHIKLEEAIFTENYSKSGQKPQAESKTDSSSQENSEDAANKG